MVGRQSGAPGSVGGVWRGAEGCHQVGCQCCHSIRPNSEIRGEERVFLAVDIPVRFVFARGEQRETCVRGPVRNFLDSAFGEKLPVL